MKGNLRQVPSTAIPRVTSTQIVCGDCAGLGLLPVKTFLTSVYTCSRCAGRNYVLATTLSGALARHLMTLKQGEQNR
jgi:DnaJ-class molecular chaperone